MRLLDERAPGSGATKTVPERRDEADDAPLRIRCPLCKWNHDWRPHWMCELCDAVFDTFLTRAHCPDPTCGNSWELTWCPTCHQPSPHEDWWVKISGPSSTQ